jgi:hypothetical protein
VSVPRTNSPGIHAGVTDRQCDVLAPFTGLFLLKGDLTIAQRFNAGSSRGAKHVSPGGTNEARGEPFSRPSGTR